MRTRLREFFSHWPDPDQTPTAEQLHALRISIKRLRYSAESLGEFYPDRLALLLGLLKQLQDVLGELQDYATQRALIEADLVRHRAKSDQQSGSDEPDPDLAVIESLISDYRRRQEERFARLSLLWRGIVSKKFHGSLKYLISHPVKPSPASEDAVTHG